jgi:hypothetical protein
MRGLIPDKLPKIAKAQAQYHTRCQYELVLSKWPTIVKISRGFLARSAGNSDFLKIKNQKKSMRHKKWMRALMINRDIFLHGLNNIT